MHAASKAAAATMVRSVRPRIGVANKYCMRMSPVVTTASINKPKTASPDRASANQAALRSSVSIMATPPRFANFAARADFLDIGSERFVEAFVLGVQFAPIVNNRRYGLFPRIDGGLIWQDDGIAGRFLYFAQDLFLLGVKSLANLF